MGIFNFFGSLCGYVLWACFLLVKNFGVAIILFTLFFKIIMIPTTIKQQKSMAVTQRLNGKQQAIKEKYANNKQKMNEEIQKLYEKENASPMSGCLVSFVPLIIFMSIFYSVGYPLMNTLHINSDTVNSLTAYVNQIPGLASSSGTYSEINFIRIFSNIKDTSFITGLLSPDDISKIEFFSSGFNFLGLDLLQVPKTSDNKFMLIIPILCLVTSIASQVILTKIQGSAMQQQGCMLIMLYGMPFFTAYLAWTIPAAVGLYWIVSTVISFVTSLIMNRFYNAQMITARQEAQRIALLEINEGKIAKR